LVLYVIEGDHLRKPIDMGGKIIINCSGQKQVVQMHYGRETGCADVQPQRTWLCMSYGTETSYADV
jgi:hypothetical protein